MTVSAGDALVVWVIMAGLFVFGLGLVTLIKFADRLVVGAMVVIAAGIFLMAISVGMLFWVAVIPFACLGGLYLGMAWSVWRQERRGKRRIG